MFTTRINCGYARVAIRTLSRAHNDKESRQTQFQAMFKPVSGYIPNTTYFEPQEKQRDSKFDRGCTQVLKQFNKKWHPNGARCEYMATFSPECWKHLPLHKKLTHTLENCQGCQIDHAELQTKFPGTHTACSSIQQISSGANRASASMLTEPVKNKHVAQSATRKALSIINVTSEDMLGMSFSEAIVKYCPEEKVISKPTDAQRKHKQCQITRKCTKHIEDQIGQKEALNVLAENQSLGSYKRMRISQSFETPEAKRQRYEKGRPQPKKHSPDFTNVTWNKEKLRCTLEKWPETETIIWSRVAQEHGITARNGGQIVKEFAAENGFDTVRFDNRRGGKRMRAKKLKMPGGEISVPCHKTVNMIKLDWEDMIESGELTLGEPCAPCTITKYAVVDGKIQKSECEVHGRKIPLIYIRKKLLQKHETYMRLHTDEELENMSGAEITRILNLAQVVIDDDADSQQLRELLQKLERTRTLAIWHDHSTLLGKGYVMITAKIIYDKAVFKTRSELGAHVDSVQTITEQPQIHNIMLAVCSSAVENQAALIGDRNSCISDLCIPLHDSRGTEVKDELVFFYGDKAAQQVERGTQQGGAYKCGSCGCESHMMDDFAYSMRCICRSLADLQSIALSGIYGKQPSVIRPFQTLSSKKLQE